MTDNKNTILAIVLSAIVLIGWQFFFAMPQEKARQEKLARAAGAKASSSRRSRASRDSRRKRRPPSRDQRSRPVKRAEAAVRRHAATRHWRNPPRVAIATGSVQGSIALKGGRIDDLALVKFRETVDPKSPPIVLLSPSGSPGAVLRRIRLDQRRRRQCEGADIGHGVEASRHRARSASAIR